MTEKEYTPLSESNKSQGPDPDLLVIAKGFAKENKEFKAVDLQRYLQCGFGTVIKVLDALCDNHIIEAQNTTPRTYKSLIE